MIKYILVLFFIISFPSFSSDILLLEMRDSDYVIKNDLKGLSQIDIKRDIILEGNFPFMKSSLSLLEWLKEDGLTILGKNFEFKICISNEELLSTEMGCNNDYNALPSMKKAKRLALLDKRISLFFPYETVKDSSHNLMLVLSDNTKVDIKKAQPALSIDSSLDSFPKGLSEKAKMLYRVSLYSGLVYSKKKFISNTLFNCIENDFELCQIGDTSVYALTGLMLNNFINSCTECSNLDKGFLAYYSAQYLLRVKNGTTSNYTAYKTYKIGMNSGLDKEYENNLKKLYLAVLMQ